MSIKTEGKAPKSKELVSVQQETEKIAQEVLALRQNVHSLQRRRREYTRKLHI